MIIRNLREYEKSNGRGQTKDKKTKMNVPTPVQDIIIENLVGTGGVRTASMVCKRWCLHARSVYAISKWGNLALVENYDSWAELIKDGNARNKPKVSSFSIIY